MVIYTLLPTTIKLLKVELTKTGPKMLNSKTVNNTLGSSFTWVTTLKRKMFMLTFNSKTEFKV